MTAWIVPLAVGIGTGVLSAWGVGGGTLLLLVMTLFLGVDQRTAQGINLLFFLPTAASAQTMPIITQLATGSIGRIALSSSGVYVPAIST